MITLTEKRLQELENKVTALQDASSQHKNSIDSIDVGASNHDLEDIRRKFHVLNDRFNDFMNSSNASMGYSETHHSLTQKSLQDHLDSIKDLYASLDSLTLTINRVARNMDDLKEEVRGLAALDLEKSGDISALESLIKENSRRLDSHKESSIITAANAIDGLSYANLSLSQNKQNLKKIEDLEEQLKKSNCYHESNIDGIRKNVIDYLQSMKENTPESPKSYDDEISSLRKDVNSVLETSASIKNISQYQDQMSAKMKVMERSLAQVYTLLKNYETR